ncbi:hypothetical protein F2P81_012590 [Scophthalmus maximus]|uniref:DH domain-containing protein n=1 Tax=Scophthalmus maximus TaxID=52904 RepID=A0A6A4SXT1_SCOMX|nr:hypothetical protein F2P81_012590 [Scophthalmus maximus]
MAQLDCEEENDCCLSSSTFTNLHSYFENGHLVNNLKAQTPTPETREELSEELTTLDNYSAQVVEGLDESNDSLRQPEDGRSHAMDISSAISSVALNGTWALGKMLNLFSVPGLEDDSSLSSSDDQDKTEEGFLMDLEMRLGESVLITQVGDIVLQHCPEFHKLYVPYVTNMMYQEALVNQLLQQNRDFLYSLKKLEGDPVCQRRDLKSFLVLPFQRITRFKLLLENILKLTEPDSDSISNLEKAIEAIHEIVAECDQGVRKMKQIEELVSLEMHLDFDKVKSVPLVVSGRFLMHQGSMKQLMVEGTYSSRPSFIGVYLHLFNDLLIISLKKYFETLFTVK